MAGQGTKREWTPIALLINIAALAGLGIALIWGLDWRWFASGVVTALVIVIACGARDAGRKKAAENDEDLAAWFDKLGAAEPELPRFERRDEQA